MYGLYLAWLSWLSLSQGAAAAAFSQNTHPQTTNNNNVMADQAVALFATKYPFGRDPPKANFLTGETGTGKRFCDISEPQARDAFGVLSKLYGNEESLEMVRILPLSLAFKSNQFEPSLQEFSAIFGEVEAKAMVSRNPGLLAVSPEEAAKSNEQTMAFSYIVATTRPLSGVLLPGLLALLLVPVVEKLTGVNIGF